MEDSIQDTAATDKLPCVHPVTEILARAWIACDPNRAGADPDEIIGQSCEGGTGQESRCYDTPLTGRPQWHWFIPRAEALKTFLQENGIQLAMANP